MLRLERCATGATLVLLTALAALLAAGPGLAQGSWKLVVHPSMPVGSMAREDVAKLFLKKVVRMPDGRQATPVDLPERSPVREAFGREVLKKSPSSAKAYWQQEIFSGRAVPPIVKASDADVVRYVSENRSAIGYVSAGADVAGVKVVTVE